MRLGLVVLVVIRGLATVRSWA